MKKWCTQDVAGKNASQIIVGVKLEISKFDEKTDLFERTFSGKHVFKLHLSGKSKFFYLKCYLNCMSFNFSKGWKWRQ